MNENSLSRRPNEPWELMGPTLLSLSHSHPSSKSNHWTGETTMTCLPGFYPAHQSLKNSRSSPSFTSYKHFWHKHKALRSWWMAMTGASLSKKMYIYIYSSQLASWVAWLVWNVALSVARPIVWELLLLLSHLSRRAIVTNFWMALEFCCWLWRYRKNEIIYQM